MPPITAHHGRMGSPDSRSRLREAVELWERLFLRTGVWGIFAVFLGAQPYLLAQEVAPADELGLHALYYGAHLPEDRGLERKLERAVELLERRRFSEALPILDELLAAEQDVFLDPVRADDNSPVSAKSRVGELLTSLPPAGREAYLLLFDAEATRQVKQAIEANDRRGLMRAAARFGPTSAGEEATLILSQMAADRGEFDDALRMIDRLLKSPSSRERWGDYLVLRAAELAARLGDSAVFEARLSDSTLRGEAANDLRRLLSSSAPIRRPQPEDRNPTSPPGTPHLWERWQARVIVDRRLEAQLHSRRDRRRDTFLETPLLPSAIAVGDLVVARSLNHLVAIDWNTGKRIWETRSEQAGWLDSNDDTFANLAEANYGRGRIHPLLLRLWKDAAYASLSSDGRRVYAIGNLDYATEGYNSRWGMLPGFADGGDRRSRLTNCLAAYQIAAEGKLAWEIDGAKPNHALSGAFFLGAPVACCSSLYAMAEIDSSIYLVELNGEDGRLLWKQPLVSLERGIDQDVGRRLCGAVLSARNGVLVCPTGAGVVAAVNAFDRTLLWSYQIPVHKSAVDQQEEFLQRRTYGGYRQLENQWLDAKAILSDEYVVLTTPDSPNLHCLRLATGAVAWTRPREEGLYLAGLTDSAAIVVGKREVEAIGLSDGELKWSNPHPEGRFVSGRGLIGGDVFWLPLDEGYLSIFSVADGKQQQLLKTHAGQSVGNLISHRGSVVSQSLAIVDRFDRQEELQSEIEKRFAGNSNDAMALRLSGELAETAGKIDESLALFKRSHAADAEDPLARERVVGALLSALKRDFSRHREDLPLLESLAADPALRLEVLQLKADGLAAAGEIRGAFACCLEAYQEAADRDFTMLETTGGSARIDAWFRGSVTRLWHASDAETQAWISETADELKASLSESAPLASMERFASYFGTLPGQESILVDLADRYQSAGRRRDAELTWLQLLTSGDAPSAREASARLIRTISPETLETSPAQARAQTRWPTVQIAAETSRKRRLPGSRGARPNEEAVSYAPIRFDYSLMEELGPARLAWANGGAEIVVWDVDGDVVTRGDVGLGRERGRLNPRSDVNHQGRMGNFAFLSLDGHTVGLDLYPANTGDNLRLWSRNGEWKQVETTPGRHSDRQRFSPAEAQLQLVAPTGIVLSSGDILYCVHPVTGDLLWFRRGTPASPWICGDSEQLYVGAETSNDGKIIAMADGAEVGSWQAPHGSRLASAGHRILIEQELPSGLAYRIIDLRDGDVALTVEMESGTRSTSVGPGLTALLDPSGRLEVLDIEAGEIAISQKLHSEPKLYSFQAIREGERLYVLTNTLSDADQNLAGYASLPGQTATTGRIYSIEVATGALQWTRPVEVTGRVVLPLQPPASPALLLASFRPSAESSSKEGSVELLAIDVATGQSVFRSDSLPQLPQDAVAVHVDRQPHLALLIESRQWEVRLSPTTTPRPPEPVANDDVELAGSRGKDGLWGVGRQLGRVLEDVLRGGVE